MAFEIPGMSLTLKAGADLAAYTFVKLSAANTVVPVSAVTDVAVGVVQDDYKSGQAATVMVAGVTKVKTVAAGVTAGAVIAPSAGALAQAAVATQTTAGTMLDAPGASEVGSALIFFSGNIKA